MPEIIKPRLSAHRGDTDEQWRIQRLVDAWEWACKTVDLQGRQLPWKGAVVAMHDHKGELTVTWRSPYDLAWYSGIMRGAWHSVDEFTPIRNRVNVRAPDPRRASRRDLSRTKSRRSAIAQYA